jgi:adenine-specific DNA-methyltransferase
MDKLKMHSLDGVERNIELIGKLFPNAITEVMRGGKVEHAIDFDVLRQELSDSIVEGREERYQFTWPDKKKAMLAANAPITATLRPVVADSVGKDGTPGGFDSENLYIEGDNLEVLKLLQETYLGKVKMIYIDPPYNTGNDFVYEDDFAQSAADYMDNSGQYDEEGNRLVTNTESNGRFHTDWLNMIYPRLKIAKDLLADDGVIFISINDYEYENLHKICDEIFGRVHYLGTIVWKARVKPVNIGEAKYRPQKEIEYILCYEKDFSNNKFYPLITGSVRSYPYSLDGRKYRLATILKSNRGTNQRTTMSFELNGYRPPEGQRWQAGNSEIHNLWSSGYIEFKDGTPFRRYFEDEEGAEHDPFYCFMENEWSSTSEVGKSELNELLGQFHGFDTVKPITLIHTLAMSCTHDNDIILDFFSGSATTAHSIIKLNCETKMKRKFILVQIPELCTDSNKIDGVTVKNICEIGKERIRRAGKKIKEEAGLTAPADLDIGFRCLRLDESNMKPVYYTPDEVGQQDLFSLVDNVKPDRTPEDLLFQVMLDLGVLLSSPIEVKEIAGKKVFNVADGFLLACFDHDVTDETVKAIAQMKPYYAVFRDSSMANDSVATNFEQIFETYSPDTVRKVL